MHKEAVSDAMNHVLLVEMELLFVQPVSILSLQLLTKMEHAINVMLLIVPPVQLRLMDPNQYVKIVWKALS